MDIMQEVRAALPSEARDGSVLGQLEPPAWERFKLASRPAAAAAMIPLIAGWPRGIFTQLKKKYPDSGLSSGYDSKEFWTGAERALVALGVAAIEPLQLAVNSKSPHQKVFGAALQKLLARRKS